MSLAVSRSAATDADWRETYASMIATPEQAVAQLGPGQRVFIGTGCAEPLELVRALAGRAGELPDTEIVHLLTFGEAPYAHEELARRRPLRRHRARHRLPPRQSVQER